MARIRHKTAAQDDEWKESPAYVRGKWLVVTFDNKVLCFYEYDGSVVYDDVTDNYDIKANGTTTDT